jgi:hypothetical protein
MVAVWPCLHHSGWQPDSEQATPSVDSDEDHYYLGQSESAQAHTRDTQADSEQVESPDPFANEPKPMSSQRFDFPQAWKFVSAQLKNSKGGQADEIFQVYPVNDE